MGIFIGFNDGYIYVDYLNELAAVVCFDSELNAWEILFDQSGIYRYSTTWINALNFALEQTVMLLGDSVNSAYST